MDPGSSSHSSKGSRSSSKGSRSSSKGSRSSSKRSRSSSRGSSSGKAKSHRSDFDSDSDSFDSSPEQLPFKSVDDLLNEAHSQPKSKSGLTLTTSRRIRELALNGWTNHLLKKMFKGYSSSEPASNRRAVTVSKMTNHVQQPFLTLTDVKVWRLDNKGHSGRVKYDEISKVFFKLDDKIFAVSPAETRGVTFHCSKRIFFVDNSKSLHDGGHLVCSLANVIEFNKSDVGDKSCRLEGNDNSLIGRKYRVAGNSKADKNNECTKMLDALMAADSQNSLEIVATDPEDLLQILVTFGVGRSLEMRSQETFASFLSDTDNSLVRGMNEEQTEGAVMKGMSLVDELKRRRDRRYGRVFMDDLWGGSRRYSSKRRSLRKSRTMKKRK